MKLLAKSTEARIFKQGKLVFKIYNHAMTFNKMEREYKFLQKYQKTGVVPKLYSTLDDLRDVGLIVMEFFDGYTLKSFIKNKKQYTPTQHLALLKAILNARYAIGPDQEYHDLHSKNVMVKVSGNNAYVRLIDPGQITDHNGAPVWLDWMETVAKEMGMLRGNPLGNAIKRRDLRVIRTYLH